MKEIALTQGQVTLVDDADFEWLSQWKWYAAHSRAVRSPIKGAPLISMARVILGLTDPKMAVDHRNGNTLDNRRQNLRPATASQNAANRKLRKDNQLGTKGVSRAGKKFRADIEFQGVKLYLGVFSTANEAQQAYNDQAVQVFGSFAKPVAEQGNKV